MADIVKGGGRAPHHPHQTGPIFPSWWNVRQKVAIATLCVLPWYLPSRTMLWCKLQVRGQIHSPYFYSTPLCTLWAYLCVGATVPDELWGGSWWTWRKFRKVWSQQPQLPKELKSRLDSAECGSQINLILKEVWKEPFIILDRQICEIHRFFVKQGLHGGYLIAKMFAKINGPHCKGVRGGGGVRKTY